MRSKTIRRSRTLACYWEHEEFVCANYLAGTQVVVGPALVALLAKFDESVSLAAARKLFSRTGAADALSLLLEAKILVVDGTKQAALEDSLLRTWRWGVDAQFFHYGTRRVAYTFDHNEVRRALTAKAKHDPPPSPFKACHVTARPLPKSPEQEGAFWQTLYERRTCRSFGTGFLSAGQLSLLLASTFGKVRFFDDAPIDRRVIKTSPSGGARHPIEAYVVVQRVRGLAKGTYHYDVKTHGLCRLRDAPSKSRLVRMFSGQGWVADASVVVVLTAMLERSMWKYDHSRALRVVLLDAGHVGQTLHLVATEMGLGVFTTAALQDPAIETFLGVDGIAEVVIYGGAVGPKSHAA